jgi:hypothetical protein
MTMGTFSIRDQIETAMTSNAEKKAQDIKCRCGSPLTVRKSPDSRDGNYFFACTKCDSIHSAYRINGDRLKGASGATYYARAQAKAAFDNIWRNCIGSVDKTREAAYVWLADKLEITRRGCDVSGMDAAFCQKVVETCKGVTAAQVQAYEMEKAKQAKEAVERAKTSEIRAKYAKTGILPKGATL